MLQDILGSEPYALGLSPGFFRFYALTGVLHGLSDHGCLSNVTHVSGASAGALVGGFLASGKSPAEMADQMLNIQREDMWDFGGIGGLLRGEKFQKLLESHLSVSRFEDTKIPLGVTAWELFNFRTKIVTSGNLATAIRASCTFPLLFQPVNVDGSYCIDGGVWDDGGLMALPGIPESELVVNIVCERTRLGSSILPDKYRHAKLLTLIVDNIPHVTPLTMSTSGPYAYKLARAATYVALANSHIQQLSESHWCAFIDGKGVDPDMPLVPTMRRNSSSLTDVSIGSTDSNFDDQNMQQRPSYPFLIKRSTSGVVPNTTSSLPLSSSSFSSAITRACDNVGMEIGLMFGPPLTRGISTLTASSDVEDNRLLVAQDDGFQVPIMDQVMPKSSSKRRGKKSSESSATTPVAPYLPLRPPTSLKRAVTATSELEPTRPSYEADGAVSPVQSKTAGGVPLRTPSTLRRSATATSELESMATAIALTELRGQLIDNRDAMGGIPIRQPLTPGRASSAIIDGSDGANRSDDDDDDDDKEDLQNFAAWTTFESECSKVALRPQSSRSYAGEVLVVGDIIGVFLPQAAVANLSDTSSTSNKKHSRSEPAAALPSPSKVAKTSAQGTVSSSSSSSASSTEYSATSYERKWFLANVVRQTTRAERRSGNARKFAVTHLVNVLTTGNGSGAAGYLRLESAGYFEGGNERKVRQSLSSTPVATAAAPAVVLTSSAAAERVAWVKLIPK